MLAICDAHKPVVFKAPKTLSKDESVSQGTKPGAQTGHKKPLTSSKQPSMSSKEATKGGSFKAPNGSKTGHSKKRKESSSAMDSNPSQPPVFTLVDTGMHKEDQQATGGPTSLRVTSEERSNPQLNSGCDALADSTAEADPGLSAPNDSIPQQQGMDEGTKNTSYDHIFAGTDPHVLAYQTKSISEGLETVLTQPITGKGASSIARQVEEEEASSIIKLEDLVKLVSNVEPNFKDLDSPEDDPVIVVDDSDEDEKDEVYPTPNAKIEDTLVLISQLNELLVKSLKSEFSKILSTHDFSSSLPTELKDLPSKFYDLIKEVKGLKNQVHNLEIELPGDLKEIPPKLEDFTKTVTSLTSQVAELKTLQWELPAEFLAMPSQVEMVQAKLKTLDAFLSLLKKFINALNQYGQAITSKKTGGDNVPSAGQAGTQPTEGEKNTNQATISQLFQRTAERKPE
ncbi:hypothetical protein Tco_1548946 [Tanacetum coccineum]